jgi:hypothetical protein
MKSQRPTSTSRSPPAGRRHKRLYQWRSRNVCGGRHDLQ